MSSSLPPEDLYATKPPRASKRTIAQALADMKPPVADAWSRSRDRQPPRPNRIRALYVNRVTTTPYTLRDGTVVDVNVVDLRPSRRSDEARCELRRPSSRANLRPAAGIAEKRI